jgi:hypothetical protein
MIFIIGIGDHRDPDGPGAVVRATTCARRRRRPAIALSQLQADAIEQAAEQWVLAQVDLNATSTTAPPSTSSSSSATGSSTPVRRIHGRWFTTRRPRRYRWARDISGSSGPTRIPIQDYDYGIVDESSKLNLNAIDVRVTATTNACLKSADEYDVGRGRRSDVDWKNTASHKASADGAESDYYNGLTGAVRRQEPAV